MTIVQASNWFMLFFCGLWAGGILIFAVERTNLWNRMPIEQFAVDFRRSVLRVDPMMPILGLIAGGAGVVFALNSEGAGRPLAWAGLALLAMVIVGSILIAEPMNSKFRRLAEGEIPQAAEQLRARWRRFHRARTIAALASFACLSAAAAMASPTAI